MIAMGAIDNLGKGAAGQAVQNANLITGQPETAGLERRRRCGRESATFGLAASRAYSRCVVLPTRPSLRSRRTALARSLAPSRTRTPSAAPRSR